MVRQTWVLLLSHLSQLAFLGLGFLVCEMSMATLAT